MSAMQEMFEQKFHQIQTSNKEQFNAALEQHLNTSQIP